MDGYYWYFIKNQTIGLYLQVGDPCHGNQVTLSHKNGGHSQLWRFDPGSGTIRSKQNDLCMDIECGHLVLHPHQPGKQDQQWERDCNMIVSRCDRNMVLAVAGCGSKVVKSPLQCAKNQGWIFEALTG